MELGLTSGLGERLVNAKAGAVDQHLNVSVEIREIRGQAVALVGHSQVGSDRRSAIIATELLCQLSQPLLAPGHERHPVAALAQLARELLTDPGRSSGDHRDGTR